MIGQVLSGNYRLTDLVGSGGYADVYLARDLRSNTIVAVKILHAHVARKKRAQLLYCPISLVCFKL
jgi:serine/threonine-protein kinase